jgi:hypothetical protein
MHIEAQYDNIAFIISEAELPKPPKDPLLRPEFNDDRSPMSGDK